MELRLKTLLNRFGQFVPPRLLDMEDQNLRFGDTISSANLSCQAMVRTAGIKIVWVDAFSLHLEFDARTTTLKLFRFPSFCAMLAHPQCSGSLLFDRLLSDGATNDVESSSGAGPAGSPITQDFFLELLCTYRLVFGQHGRSARKLYRKIKPSGFVPGTGTDPLLDELCGTSSNNHPLWAAIDAFPEKVLYSAESDFPAFGNRLLTLQRYINSQSPNSIKALWYDRRDTHRFWTFWAVIFFGGFSIILSFTQTVLSGLQIDIARQGGNS
ncbi:predicted protein [Chaetomium globosum CBS 148.51]|uniref:Uncharacterized protein n=1 Tax=Chaetomium globosum (strain ATCC 6205 / CBS 148.51 / DSM 1962 / NBRC 6347 / NRRL 1970) TaxID=306901 RepID=Q2GN42_CHAGB|nr:uncharacterized protein CHGG_10612 [Chaetomium globosum CBS 148.51]EAQ84208.1 predicted protein [Chaetomium globosum CBS 148.51]